MHYRTGFLTFLFLTFLLSVSAHAIELNTDIEQSPNDNRDYAYFTLPNQLKVFLVSDKDADKAAASLDIRVGSANDPNELPGLAHFLEHMLFLGTEKYPDPDAYQKFISDHGGGHNAYTSLENTNYFFDINADYLQGALDRFSQQFTAPLFNEDYVQREVNAVHSEYSSKIQDDGRRYLESLKAVLNPKHPYRRFAVGNLETLVDTENKTLRQALIEFHNAEYSANRMRLTVLGREDLGTLAQWVEARFAQIPNKDLPVKDIATPFFSGGFLPAKLSIKNIMDTRSLALNFPIPSTRAHINSKPMNYLANLIGHEGKGSLLSALKEKQLVDTLSAGTQFDTGVNAMFIVNMTLTPKGSEKQDEIIETVFSYIALVKENEIRKLYFDEEAKLTNINFKFSEKGSPMNYVRSLSAILHEFEPNEVLSATYKLTEFNPKLITSYLEHLNPENMLVTVRSKDVNANKETTWFKAPYAVKELSISQVNALKKAKALPELALPQPNDFIPENTDLVTAANDEVPRQLDAPKGVELWHATDTEFGTPKATAYVSIRSPNAMGNVEQLVMTQILVSMLNDNLIEFAYPAFLAGLSYDLYKHVRGITIKIAGYSDKQETLLEAILKNIKSSELRAERFTNITERLKRSLENEKEKKPFQQAISKVQETVLVPSWSAEEKLSALATIDIEKLRVFKELFFSEIDTAILSNGNIEDEATLALAKVVETHLLQGASIKKVERAKIRKLEGKQDWVEEIDIDHPDTSLVYYMQGNNKSFLEQARYSLLAQAIGTDYYALLRTEKQLGYIVFASPFSMLEVPAIAFIVQSPNTSADVIFDETKTFISDQKSALSELSQEEFARYKKAVISRLEEKETQINQRSNRYWSEIDKENYSFDSKQKLIAAIESIELSDFQAFYRGRADKKGASFIVFNNPTRDSAEDLDKNMSEHTGDDANGVSKRSDLRELLKQKRSSMSSLPTI